MRQLKIALALVFVTVCSQAGATTKVDNFRLLDQNLQAHELYYHKDATAIVFLVQSNGCPIARNLVPDLRDIRASYADKGVEFALINSSLQDTRGAIRDEAESFEIDFPILVDETQLIGEALELDRSGEVIVVDPKTWTIAYRGPLSDRVGYETQKQQATENYLSDALASMVAGEPIAEPRRNAVGCIVNFPEREQRAEHAKISYADTIAPLLQNRCVDCHRPGGIGPWAMTSYEMIKGFSPMIREVVRTRRMPPWEVATDLPEIHGARALTVDEKKTLIHWIEAGAPRGDGEDPLLAVAAASKEWPLGEPDLVVKAPPFTVPATGILDYQFPAINNPLEEDVWVRAVSIQPGAGEVVHHVLIGTTENMIPEGDQRLDAVFGNYLMGYAPGAESYIYPDDTGVLVKAGGQIHLQMHYTSYGREVTDETEVALYFHKEMPRYNLRQQVVIGPDVQIPPGVERHTESAYFEFARDAEIYSLFPHAHFRGVETRFDLHMPDGTKQPLLHVPRYDFNWQHTYSLAEPVSVPAGTRLVHSTVYNNSERNPANPDATREVPWGLQSYDEMLYGGFFFRWTEGTAKEPVHDELNFNIAQMFGGFDDDFDGVLSVAEMPGGLGRAFEAGRLDPFNRDGDKTLSMAEYRSFVEYRRKQAAQQAQSSGHQ